MLWFFVFLDFFRGNEATLKVMELIFRNTQFLVCMRPCVAIEWFAFARVYRKFARIGITK